MANRRGGEVGNGEDYVQLDAAGCPFCLEALDEDAGRTPCMHPICAVCVDKTTDARRKCLFLLNEQIYCHADFTRAELLLPRPAPALLVLCQSCEEAPATHRCETCGGEFCEDEAKTHPRAKTTKGHVVKRKPGVGPDMPMCYTHPGKLATLFCDRCDQMACNDCIAAPHDAHPFITVDKGLEKQRANLVKLADEVLPHVELCDSGLRAVEVNIEFLIEHKNASTRTVAEYFDALIRPLDTKLTELRSRKFELTKEVEDAVTADIKALLEQKDSLLLAKDHLVRAHDGAATAPVGSTMHDTVMREQIMARLRVLKAREINAEPVVCVTTDVAFSVPNPSIADVLDVDASTMGATWLRELHARNYSSIGAPAKTLGTGKAGDPPQNFYYPVAIQFTPLTRQLIVAELCNNASVTTLSRVQFFKEGVYARNLTNSRKVYGIDIAPTGSIWMALQDDNVVELVNATTGARERSINCSHARTIAVLDDGSLLVGCYNSSTVIRFNADGSQRWSSRGNANLGYVTGVVAIASWNLAVCCDNKNNRLQVLALDTGAFIRVIAEGQVAGPSGLAWDSCARVLVVGEKDKVSAWTLEGIRVHVWAQGLVSDARGVAISPLDGTIAVTSFNSHKVLLF